MSIEKLDFATITQEKIPYTQVCNKVIQKITDPVALAVWVYLLSMPIRWRVNKNQLMKHFKIGERKLEGILSYLRKTNLIEYIHTRDDKKRITAWTINVLSGSKFNENGHLENEKATPQDLQPVDNSTPQISTPVAFHPCRSDGRINKTMLIKENEKQKERPSLFSFKPSQAALEAATAKHLDIVALRKKFELHYSGENEFGRNWIELFHKWILSEKAKHSITKNESAFADVTKQSTSYGFECELAAESQRKWEERMREYGYSAFGT